MTASATSPPGGLPSLGRYDVAVVGSGSAGSPAAIAAARTGASVLLVEKLPFLGGVSTAVLDTFYGFYTPGSRPVKVVGGVGDDVIAGLRSRGDVLERPNTYGAGTGVDTQFCGLSDLDGFDSVVVCHVVSLSSANGTSPTGVVITPR